MAENDWPPPPPQSASEPAAPVIALLPKSSGVSFSTGGLGLSPGPMTLAASLFAGNDSDSDWRWFCQLLAGGGPSPAAAPNVRQNTVLPAAESRGGAGESVDFRIPQNRPAGLAVSQQSGMLTIRPGLSPAGLLDSPGHFPSSQVSRQHFSEQAQAQMHFQSEFPSLSAAPASSLHQLKPPLSRSSLQQNVPLPIADCSIIKESSDISQYDQNSRCIAVEKPADDEFSWRKYGQKQVKGSECPRSYYKCTNPECPVKKKVERSLDGRITKIIYKGEHNHPPPSKHTKENADGAMNHHGVPILDSEDQAGTPNKPNEGVTSNNQESSQVTPEHVSGSSGSEEAGDAETRVNGKDDDEPEFKRRNIKLQTSERVSSDRMVTEPRFIVQTTSEVDLLDDGYRWRKYGQKVVKGNPNPRSYYKCSNFGCNVRRHVERAASDPKTVLTTYEGKHNHEVPAAKTSTRSIANCCFTVGTTQCID